MQETSDVLTREETALFLKCPLQTLDYLVRENLIPFSRMGKRSIRFLRPRLVEWLIEREGIQAPLKKRAGNN